jgi:hypothetical protein
MDDYKTDLEGFKENVQFLNGCCLRHGDVADVSKIARLINWSGPSGDSTEYGIFQHEDKRFGVIVDSSDYTGHGCQCGSSCEFYDTLEDAIRLGLDPEGREKLGYPPVDAKE